MSKARTPAQVRQEMELVDSLTPEMRALVNEYGLDSVVEVATMVGTADPAGLTRLLERNQRMLQLQLEQEATEPPTVH